MAEGDGASSKFVLFAIWFFSLPLTFSRLLFSSGWGLARFAMWLLLYGGVIAIALLLVTPLIWAAANHEAALHDGVLGLQIAEEGYNVGVEVVNSGLDIFRPFQPMWNWVNYNFRRLVFFWARLLLIAIEEIVEVVLAPDAGSEGLPGCTMGDWTTFADIDLKVCMFSFMSVDSPVYREYGGRSKIVEDLPALLDGTHAESEDFWDVFLHYGGPQMPVHHPSDVLTADEKRGHWAQFTADGVALDGAQYAIPLASWATSEEDTRAVKQEVRDYFDAFPDISVMLYYWDRIVSSLVYGVIDVLGFVADILYDILEFAALLLLEVAASLFVTLYDAAKWVFLHLGPVVTLVVSIAEDGAEVAFQFLTNTGDCLFGNEWSCGSTKEVYTCCEDFKLFTKEQCQHPARFTVPAAGEAVQRTQFGADTMRVCTALTGDPGLTNKDAPIDGVYNATHRECYEGVFPNGSASMGLHTAAKTPHFPWSPKEYFVRADGLNAADGSARYFDGVSFPQTFLQLPDVWPFHDELDTQAYAESYNGLNQCSGKGPVTTWTCDSAETSYFNSGFETVASTAGPFGVPRPSNHYDSTQRVCEAGGDFSVPVSGSARFGEDLDGYPPVHCMRAHARQTCIREVEDTGFLHDVGTLNSPRARRSASLEASATNPEGDAEYRQATQPGGKCAAGCGTESVDSSSVGTLDFWGHRDVKVWDCQAGGSGSYDADGALAGFPGVFANDSDASNNFARHGDAGPVHVWYVGSCGSNVTVASLSGGGPPCTDQAFLKRSRDWCREVMAAGGAWESPSPLLADGNSGASLGSCARGLADSENGGPPADSVVDEYMRRGCCPYRVTTTNAGDCGGSGNGTAVRLCKARGPDSQEGDTQTGNCNYPGCTWPLSRPLSVPSRKMFDDSRAVTFWEVDLCGEPGVTTDKPCGGPNYETNPELHAPDVVRPTGSLKLRSSEMNALHLSQYCSFKVQRFAFPHFCTCGSGSCMAPVLNYVVELIAYVEDYVGRMFRCAFFFDRYRCCGAGLEPKKPGQHSQLFRYANFGPSSAVADAEVSKQMTLTPTETGPQAGAAAEAFAVRWNTKLGVQSGPSTDLLATSDEIFGGGIGSGQPCYMTSTMMGTEPVCKHELMEEECCGYCTAWVYKYTRLSAVQSARAAEVLASGHELVASGNPTGHKRTNCHSGPTFPGEGQHGTFHPGGYVDAASQAQAHAHSALSAAINSPHAEESARAQTLVDAGAAAYVTTDGGIQAVAGVAAQKHDGSDSRARVPPMPEIEPCAHAEARPWTQDDDTEFELAPWELQLMKRLERETLGRTTGALVPGFVPGGLLSYGGSTGICDPSQAPNLRPNGETNMNVCALSALYPMRWRENLNYARHASVFHGMPFAEAEESRRSKKAGFGFWRQMIYMRKFNKNGYEWWEHLRDRGGQTRLPCGCTAPEFCPGRKATHPWVHGPSLHSTGLQAAFNMMNPYHGTDEFAHLFAVVDGLRLGNMENQGASTDAGAKVISDATYQEDWRRDVSSPPRKQIALAMWHRDVLGVPNEEAEKLHEVCAATSVPISMRSGVDYFLEPGAWNFHHKHCVQYNSQQQCDFYERNFCQAYVPPPTHNAGGLLSDAEGTPSSPSGFVPEDATVSHGSQGFLHPIEKRSYSGVAKPDRSLLRGPPSEGCTAELGLYVDDLRQRYNRMASTQKAIDPAREGRMSRWWAANIPLNSDATGGDWTRKLNAPMAAYMGLLWDAELEQDFSEARIAVTTPPAEQKYKTLGSFMDQTARLVSQWQSPASNDHKYSARWTFGNLMFGFADHVQPADQISPQYAQSLSAVNLGQAPHTDAPGGNSADLAEQEYAQLSNRLLTGPTAALFSGPDLGAARRAAIVKRTAQDVKDMNTVPPGCYIDLYLALPTSSKTPRRTMGGDAAGNRVRHNLEQRDRAAGWMSASDEAVLYAAPRSNSSDSPASWPRGGLTRAGVTQGSVYREAYAVGLYETRWHPADWKGVHGPRGPPDHAACAPPPPGTAADALEDGLEETLLPGVTLAKAAYRYVSPGSGNNGCEIDSDQYAALGQHRLEGIAHSASFSDAFGTPRTPAGTSGSLPYQLVTMAVFENDVAGADAASTSVLSAKNTGTGAVTGAVDGDTDADVRTHVTLRSTCWAAVARKWRAKGLHLIDPVAVQQVQALMAQSPDDLTNRVFTTIDSSLQVEMQTPTEAQVRARDAVFLNVLARGLEMGMRQDCAEEGSPDCRHGAYHRYGTFAMRADASALASPVDHDGSEVGDAVSSAAAGTIGASPSDLVSVAGSDATVGELTDMFLMHTQFSPAQVAIMLEQTPTRSPFGMFEPPASLPLGNTTAGNTVRSQSCAKMSGVIGGVYSPNWTAGWDEGPHGWGYSTAQLQAHHAESSVLTTYRSFAEEIERMYPGPDQTRLHDTLSLNTLLSDLTGAWFKSVQGARKAGLDDATYAFDSKGMYPAIQTVLPSDGHFCTDYDDGDDPVKNAECPVVNDSTVCKAFAKTQQAVEAAGVYDATLTSCLPTVDDGPGESGETHTISEADYDPTIGCLSESWSTAWPRTDDGEELPQCCDDCDEMARIFRGAVSCFRDWDHCTAVLKQDVGSSMCIGGMGSFVSPIVKALGAINNFLTTNTVFGVPPMQEVGSVKICSMGTMQNGKCPNTSPPTETKTLDEQLSPEGQAAQKRQNAANAAAYQPPRGDAKQDKRPDMCEKFEQRHALANEIDIVGFAAGDIVGLGGAFAYNAYVTNKINSPDFQQKCFGTPTMTKAPPPWKGTADTDGPTSSQKLVHTDRKADASETHLSTETTQISGSNMVNNIGMAGPNVGGLREINWCNFCCDQDYGFCAKNNKAGGKCYHCNGAAEGTCNKPVLAPDLADYMGYCHTQDGGDDSDTCFDLTGQQKTAQYGPKALQQMMSAVDVHRMHNAKAQPTNVNVLDPNFEQLGETPSLFNGIASPAGVTQTRQHMDRVSTATSVSSVPTDWGGVETVTGLTPTDPAAHARDVYTKDSLYNMGLSDGAHQALWDSQGMAHPNPWGGNAPKGPYAAYVHNRPSLTGHAEARASPGSGLVPAVFGPRESGGPGRGRKTVGQWSVFTDKTSARTTVAGLPRFVKGHRHNFVGEYTSPQSDWPGGVHRTNAQDDAVRNDRSLLHPSVVGPPGTRTGVSRLRSGQPWSAASAAATPPPPGYPMMGFPDFADFQSGARQSVQSEFAELLRDCVCCWWSAWATADVRVVSTSEIAANSPDAELTLSADTPPANVTTPLLAGQCHYPLVVALQRLNYSGVRSPPQPNSVDGGVLPYGLAHLNRVRLTNAQRVTLADEAFGRIRNRQFNTANYYPGGTAPVISRMQVRALPQTVEGSSSNLADLDCGSSRPSGDLSAKYNCLYRFNNVNDLGGAGRATYYEDYWERESAVTDAQAATVSGTGALGVTMSTRVPQCLGTVDMPQLTAAVDWHRLHDDADLLDLTTTFGSGGRPLEEHCPAGHFSHIDVDAAAADKMHLPNSLFDRDSEQWSDSGATAVEAAEDADRSNRPGALLPAQPVQHQDPGSPARWPYAFVAREYGQGSDGKGSVLRSREVSLNATTGLPLCLTHPNMTCQQGEVLWAHASSDLEKSRLECVAKYRRMMELYLMLKATPSASSGEEDDGDSTAYRYDRATEDPWRTDSCGMFPPHSEDPRFSSLTQHSLLGRLDGQVGADPDGATETFVDSTLFASAARSAGSVSALGVGSSDRKVRQCRYLTTEAPGTKVRFFGSYVDSLLPQEGRGKGVYATDSSAYSVCGTTEMSASEQDYLSVPNGTTLAGTLTVVRLPFGVMTLRAGPDGALENGELVGKSLRACVRACVAASPGAATQQCDCSTTAPEHSQKRGHRVRMTLNAPSGKNFANQPLGAQREIRELVMQSKRGYGERRDGGTVAAPGSLQATRITAHGATREYSWARFGRWQGGMGASFVHAPNHTLCRGNASEAQCSAEHCVFHARRRRCVYPQWALHRYSETTAYGADGAVVPRDAPHGAQPFEDPVQIWFDDGDLASFDARQNGTLDPGANSTDPGANYTDRCPALCVRPETGWQAFPYRRGEPFVGYAGGAGGAACSGALGVDVVHGVSLAASEAHCGSRIGDDALPDTLLAAVAWTPGMQAAQLSHGAGQPTVPLTESILATLAAKQKRRPIEGRYDGPYTPKDEDGSFCKLITPYSEPIDLHDQMANQAKGDHPTSLSDELTLPYATAVGFDMAVHGTFDAARGRACWVPTTTTTSKYEGWDAEGIPEKFHFPSCRLRSADSGMPSDAAILLRVYTQNSPAWAAKDLVFSSQLSLSVIGRNMAITDLEPQIAFSGYLSGPPWTPSAPHPSQGIGALESMRRGPAMSLSVKAAYRGMPQRLHLYAPGTRRHKGHNSSSHVLLPDDRLRDAFYFYSQPPGAFTPKVRPREILLGEPEFTYSMAEYDKLDYTEHIYSGFGDTPESLHANSILDGKKTTYSVERRQGTAGLLTRSPTGTATPSPSPPCASTPNGDASEPQNCPATYALSVARARNPLGAVSADVGFMFNPSFTPDAAEVYHASVFASTTALGRGPSDSDSVDNCATVLARVVLDAVKSIDDPDSPDLPSWDFQRASPSVDWYKTAHAFGVVSRRRVAKIEALSGVEKARASNTRNGGCQQPVPTGEMAEALPSLCGALWYPSTAPRRPRSDLSAQGQLHTPSIARMPEVSDLFDGGWGTEDDHDLWPAAYSFAVDLRDPAAAANHDSCLELLREACGGARDAAFDSIRDQRTCFACAYDTLVEHVERCEWSWKTDWEPPPEILEPNMRYDAGGQTTTLKGLGLDAYVAAEDVMYYKKTYSGAPGPHQLEQVTIDSMFTVPDSAIAAALVGSLAVNVGTAGRRGRGEIVKAKAQSNNLGQTCADNICQFDDVGDDGSSTALSGMRTCRTGGTHPSCYSYVQQGINEIALHSATRGLQHPETGDVYLTGDLPHAALRARDMSCAAFSPPRFYPYGLQWRPIHGPFVYGQSDNDNQTATATDFARLKNTTCRMHFADLLVQRGARPYISAAGLTALANNLSLAATLFQSIGWCRGNAIGVRPSALDPLGNPAILSFWRDQPHLTHSAPEEAEVKRYYDGAWAEERESANINEDELAGFWPFSDRGRRQQNGNFNFQDLSDLAEGEQRFGAVLPLFAAGDNGWKFSVEAGKMRDSCSTRQNVAPPTTVVDCVDVQRTDTEQLSVRLGQNMYGGEPVYGKDTSRFLGKKGWEFGTEQAPFSGLSRTLTDAPPAQGVSGAQQVTTSVYRGLPDYSQRFMGDYAYTAVLLSTSGGGLCGSLRRTSHAQGSSVNMWNNTQFPNCGQYRPWLPLGPHDPDMQTFYVGDRQTVLASYTATGSTHNFNSANEYEIDVTPRTPSMPRFGVHSLTNGPWRSGLYGGVSANTVAPLWARLTNPGKRVLGSAAASELAYSALVRRDGHTADRDGVGFASLVLEWKVSGQTDFLPAYWTDGNLNPQYLVFAINADNYHYSAQTLKDTLNIAISAAHAAQNQTGFFDAALGAAWSLSLPVVEQLYIDNLNGGDSPELYMQMSSGADVTAWRFASTYGTGLSQLIFPLQTAGASLLPTGMYSVALTGAAHGWLTRTTTTAWVARTKNPAVYSSFMPLLAAEPATRSYPGASNGSTLSKFDFNSSYADQPADVVIKQDAADAVETLRAVLGISKEYAQIVLSGTTNNPTTTENGMDYQINWCSCRSNVPAGEDSRNWVKNPRAGTTWAAKAHKTYLLTPDGASGASLRAPAPPAGVDVVADPAGGELPIGVTTAKPDYNSCGPDAASYEDCICDGYRVNPDLPHREHAPAGPLSDRGRGFAGNTVACSSRWWQALEPRAVKMHSCGSNAMSPANRRMFSRYADRTRLKDPAAAAATAAALRVTCDASESFRDSELASTNRDGATLPDHGDTRRKYLYHLSAAAAAAVNATHPGILPRAFPPGGHHYHGARVIACCSSLHRRDGSCGPSQVLDPASNLLVPNCFDDSDAHRLPTNGVSHFCCHAPPEACNEGAADAAGGRRLSDDDDDDELRVLTEEEAEAEARGWDGSGGPPSAGGAPAAPAPAPAPAAAVPRPPRGCPPQYLDDDADSAAAGEAAQATRAAVERQARGTLAVLQESTQELQHAAAAPGADEELFAAQFGHVTDPLQSRALAVRHGLVHPGENATAADERCAELLHHSGTVSGGAAPDNMGMQHKAAWYMCATRHLVGSAEQEPPSSGPLAALRGLGIDLSAASAGASRLLDHVVAASATRALPLAKQMKAAERAEKRETADGFASHFVSTLERYGINSTDVVAGYPMFERHARLLGRPHDPGWYPSLLKTRRRNVVAETACRRRLAAAQRPAEPSGPAPGRYARPGYHRRRLDEDALDVAAGGASSDWPLAPPLDSGGREDGRLIETLSPRGAPATPAARMERARERWQQHPPPAAAAELQQHPPPAAAESQPPPPAAAPPPPRHRGPRRVAADLRAAEQRQAAWVRSRLSAAVIRATGGLDRAPSEGSTATVRGMIAASLTDASALVKEAQPLAAFVTEVVGAQGVHFESTYPAVTSLAQHISAGVGQLGGDQMSRLTEAYKAQWDHPGRRALRQLNGSASGSLRELLQPRTALPRLAESVGRVFSMPDLGSAPGPETVHQLAGAFLAVADVKARALDAMGVQIVGEPWTNPDGLRAGRHDSTQHTPWGRVVRGVLSKMAPDHYRYEDHDNHTAEWASWLYPHDHEAGAIITKNLSKTQYMFVNTLMRHAPHQRMGHRLARPDYASHTVEKMALLMRGVEGAEFSRKVHPRLEELTEHAIKRHMRRSLHTEMTDTSDTSPAAQANRRRLVETFVSDNLRSAELVSIAGVFGADRPQHVTLDVAVAAALSKECNIGNVKKQWGKGPCELVDALAFHSTTEITLKPECTGCSQCMGCYVRPATCGGRGRDICQSDLDCEHTRHCDTQNCDFAILTSGTAQASARAQLCTDGPHFVNSSGLPPTAAQETQRKLAERLLADLETHFWNPKHDCSSGVFGHQFSTGTKGFQEYSNEGRFPRSTCESDYCSGGFMKFKTDAHRLDPSSVVRNLLTDHSSSAPSATDLYYARLQDLSVAPELARWAACKLGHTAPGDDWALPGVAGGEFGASAASARENLCASNVATSPCTLKTTVPSSPDCPHDAVFSGLSRDCAGVGGASGTPYVNAGETRIDPVLGHPTVHWLSPLRLSYTSGTAGGFTCPCVRPRNDNVMGNFGAASGETCVCGDFADQPSDTEFSLTFGNTWNYALYNVVLCWLYMSPEHMCFPSIPYQIPTISLADVDVRQYLLDKEINFTCAQPLPQRRYKADAAGDLRPDCNDTDLEIHLSCPAYSALVTDETALLRVAEGWPIPTLTLRQSTYSRVQNTLVASHYGMRYIVAHIVPGAAVIGDGWRYSMQLAAHGLHWLTPLRFVGLSSITSDKVSPDNWFTNFWTYPRCEATDVFASLCHVAGAAELDESVARARYATDCPRCCVARATRTPDGRLTGATGAADCSACTVSEFGAVHESTSESSHWLYSPMLYGDTRRRPRIINEECIYGRTVHPTAAMGMCFFVHAGSVIWCALVFVVLKKLFECLVPDARQVYTTIMDAAASVIETLLPEEEPEKRRVRRAAGDMTVYAYDVADALNRLGYTGEWSLAQIARAARHKAVTAGVRIVRAPLLAIDAAVDRFFARADGPPEDASAREESSSHV